MTLGAGRPRRSGNAIAQPACCERSRGQSPRPEPERQIVGQVHDPRHLRSGRRLELVHRDDRTRPNFGDLADDAETRQGAGQDVGLGFQLIIRHARDRTGRIAQQLIRIGQLIISGIHRRGDRLHVRFGGFGRRKRRRNRRLDYRPLNRGSRFYLSWLRRHGNRFRRWLRFRTFLHRPAPLPPVTGLDGRFRRRPQPARTAELQDRPAARATLTPLARRMSFHSGGPAGPGRDLLADHESRRAASAAQ